MIFDPDRAVVGVLLLPDRHDGLELVDRGARGLERGVSMWRAGGDDDRDLADGEVTDPVMHDEAQRRVLRLKSLRDLAHLRLRHLGVRLVLEVGHAFAAAPVADRTEEQHDAAEAGVAHRGERVVDRKWRRRHQDGRDRHRAAGYRRDQRHLVTVGEGLIRRYVLAVTRDHHLAPFGHEGVVLQDLEDRVLHRRSGWQFQLDPTDAGGLAIRRE